MTIPALSCRYATQWFGRLRGCGDGGIATAA
jgi:hypothetical protein